MSAPHLLTTATRMQTAPIQPDPSHVNAGLVSPVTVLHAPTLMNALREHTTVSTTTALVPIPKAHTPALASQV